MLHKYQCYSCRGPFTYTTCPSKRAKLGGRKSQRRRSRRRVKMRPCCITRSRSLAIISSSHRFTDQPTALLRSASRGSKNRSTSYLLMEPRARTFFLIYHAQLIPHKVSAAGQVVLSIRSPLWPMSWKMCRSFLLCIEAFCHGMHTCNRRSIQTVDLHAEASADSVFKFDGAHVHWWSVETAKGKSQTTLASLGVNKPKHLKLM